MELTVTGVRAKFRYGGNKQADHAREIAARLEERGTRADIAARGHLLRRNGYR
jgi:transcriptional regulator